MARELKDIRSLHPQSVDEVARVEVYYPFEYYGNHLRVVPVKENQNNPCRWCAWEKQRNTSQKCPMIKACMSRFRPDRHSVKFIGDELSSLNSDAEGQQKAALADRKCYK